MYLMSKVCAKLLLSRVSLEATSLSLQSRCKFVYTLPSSDPTLELLFVEFTEHDDDDDDNLRSLYT
ncbi:hypothetical protein Hanom_Chr12g01098891 [Helianthus anomalus]